MLIVVTNGRERDLRPAAYKCLCCGAEFRRGEERAYERHVAGDPLSTTPGCAERNAERMNAESLRAKVPGIFDPEQSGDVECAHWVSANRGLLLEGRKRL